MGILSGRSLAFLILVLIPVVAVAWTPERCILGPGDGVGGGPLSDNLSTTGQNAAHQWKAFRWRAGASGDIHVGALLVKSIPNPSMVGSADLQFAVYEDCGAGCVGNLKVWGHRSAYNFNAIGVGRHYFDLTEVVTDRRVLSGNYYWIAWRSDVTPSGSEEYMFFARQGSDPFPTGLNQGAGSMKKGCVSAYGAGGYDRMPPDGTCFNTSGINYGDNYYGWSVWTATDGGATPPRDTVAPAPPTIPNFD